MPSDSISQHFRRSEFACKCGCGFDTVDVELVEILEQLRYALGSPITITSGCRCESHNASPAVKGKAGSLHLYGRAADIKVKDVLPIAVYHALDGMRSNSLGIGLYDSWVHVDTRSGAMARWRG